MKQPFNPRQVLAHDYTSLRGCRRVAHFFCALMFRSLLVAYQARSKAVGELLLADLPAAAGHKRIGPAVSKAVFDLFN